MQPFVRPVLAIFGAVLVLFVVSSWLVGNRYQIIVSGDTPVTIGAGQMRYYRLPLNATQLNPHITGHFLASGGSGNDIEVFIADEEGFGKLMNGRQARIYYGSGKVTSGIIDAVLPTRDGTYYLVFSNRFSVISAKNVTADVNMSYH